VLSTSIISGRSPGRAGGRTAPRRSRPSRSRRGREIATLGARGCHLLSPGLVLDPAVFGQIELLPGVPAPPMPHIGRFDLVFDIGGGIASHHLDQTLARNVGLGLFVTAPRCDNPLIELTRFSVLGRAARAPRRATSRYASSGPTSPNRSMSVPSGATATAQVSSKMLFAGTSATIRRSPETSGSACS
jgi:hypothetical protein